MELAGAMKKDFRRGWDMRSLLYGAKGGWTYFADSTFNQYLLFRLSTTEFYLWIVERSRNGESRFTEVGIFLQVRETLDDVIPNYALYVI